MWYDNPVPHIASALADAAHLQARLATIHHAVFSGKVQSIKILRTTAFAVASVFLWLNSGAALNHTDDLSALRTFAVHAADLAGHITRQAALPGPDECAACLWQQAAQDLPAAYCVLPVSPIGTCRKADPLPEPVASSAIRHAQLRAPPVPLV